ncbi:MAG: DNA cytosine methyltransferase, partial [Nitrososphaera sp.]|nr:DNA cytosine methyltransferase [Nitrososphaera sp.]
MHGKRGKLYSYLVNALLIFQPKVFVFENVQGLISADSGKTYGLILDDLANLGSRLNGGGKSGHGRTSNYDLFYNDVVDATKYGVPQIRKRLIIIGVRKDLLSGLGEAEQERLRKWVANQLTGGDSLIKQFPLTVLEILQGKPLSELQDKYREEMNNYEGLWKEKDLPLAKVWKKQVWSNLTLNVVDDYLAANQIANGNRRLHQIDKAMEEHEVILRSFGWLNQPVDSLDPADRTNRQPRTTRAVRERMFRIPPDENHVFVEDTPWKVAGKGISFIYRRAFPLKPAPTVMAYGGGGTYGYHYTRTRDQLSLRERARIQTFPDSFLFKGSGEEIRAQIGEA